MLTDRVVQKAKAGLHADGSGLYLRVSPKGLRTWVKRTQAGGKDKWESLGHYPQISLSEARQRAAGTYTPPVADTSVVSMAEAMALYKDKVKLQDPAQQFVLLDELAAKFQVNSTRTELVKYLQERALKAPVQANRLLGRWKDFYNFCQNCGYITENPIATVQRKWVGGKEKARDRHLSWDEIRVFMVMLEQHTYKDSRCIPTVVALFLSLITGQRSSEMLSFTPMPGCKFLVGSVKLTPDGPKEYKVPYTPLVRFVLKKWTGQRPASDLTLSNFLRRRDCTYTPHDLRRTFVTRMADLGVPIYIPEKMVNHKLGGILDVYNHAEYLPERVAAQRLWDKKLISLWRERNKHEQATGSDDRAEPDGLRRRTATDNDG